MGSLTKKPKAPKQPEPTAQEKSLIRRQDDALSREVAEENRRKKEITRNTLGNRSLLGGIATAGRASGTSGFSGVQFSGASKPSTKGSAKSIIKPSAAPTIPNLDFGSIRF